MSLDFRSAGCWTKGSKVRRRFQTAILDWYRAHRRNLPWREDRDPYRVWLSEIMLQQTRVAAVTGHYRRFLKRFPDVETLARARESSVLAAWSGLGYYRRARMLHAASRKIVKEHEGNLPSTSAGLSELPGIGRYTAAAVASIAFGEPTAVVDGNVQRVLERLTGMLLPGEKCWDAATQLLDHEYAGDFNQALMELGATICLPGEPKCQLCPVTEVCATRGKLPKTGANSRQLKRTIFYAMDCRAKSVFLVRRSDDETVMPGMWELPEISESEVTAESLLVFRHSITVTDYSVRVSRQAVADESRGLWQEIKRVESLPLTGLTRKILRGAEMIPQASQKSS